MADEEQLDLITEDGVTAWNAWRTENPRVLTDLSGADLEACYLETANFGDTNLQGAVLKGARLAGADLSGANLSGADLSATQLAGARLPGADLTGANLHQANLQQTDLTGANFQNTNLTGTNFQKAQLRDANFRGATLESALFQSAQLNHHTLGLGRLPHVQRATMVAAPVEANPEDTPEEPTEKTPYNSDKLTVGYAKRIVGPAHWALQSLAIPNDLDEEHRDLFVELVDTVAELHQKLAATKEENRRIVDESEDLRNSIDDALPLWKSAWETFVLKAAEGAGISAGKGVVFTAGFIAGMTYSAFTTVTTGISI